MGAMQTYKAVIRRKPDVRRYNGVEKWTPIEMHGIVMGVAPEFLGFLYKHEFGQPSVITHIVAKSPGHTVYLNRVDGSGYAGVTVTIFTVESSMEFDDRIEFEVDMPFEEEFQKPRKKS